MAMGEPARYFYSSGDKEFGPYTSKELIAMAANRTISATTLIRREDSDTPAPAREWPALARAMKIKPAGDQATERYAAEQSGRVLADEPEPDTELSVLRSINLKLSFFVWVTVGWLALSALVMLIYLFVAAF